MHLLTTPPLVSKYNSPNLTQTQTLPTSPKCSLSSFSAFFVSQPPPAVLTPAAALAQFPVECNDACTPTNTFYNSCGALPYEEGMECLKTLCVVSSSLTASMPPPPTDTTSRTQADPSPPTSRTSLRASTAPPLSPACPRPPTTASSAAPRPSPPPRPRRPRARPCRRPPATVPVRAMGGARVVVRTSLATVMATATVTARGTTATKLSAKCCSFVRTSRQGKARQAWHGVLEEGSKWGFV